MYVMGCFDQLCYEAAATICQLADDGGLACVGWPSLAAI
jgi:hypothetical protein